MASLAAEFKAAEEPKSAEAAKSAEEPKAAEEAKSAEVPKAAEEPKSAEEPKEEKFQWSAEALSLMALSEEDKLAYGRLLNSSRIVSANHPYVLYIGKVRKHNIIIIMIASVTLTSI
jgi:sRNA-binding protein